MKISNLYTEQNFRKYIWVVLTSLSLITSFFVYNLKNVSFDSNFEKLFPQDDPETAYIEEFREKFSSENDYLLLIIERNEGIFNSNFLHSINELTKKIELLEHVQYVSAVTNQKEVFQLSNGQLESRPYIDLTHFKASQDSIRIFQKQELIQSGV